MIDNSTVSAIATAHGKDPATVGVVLFVMPEDHPDRELGAYVAALGFLRKTPVGALRHITSDEVVAYGDTPEDAAKALFVLLQTAAETEETEATTKAAAATAAKLAVANAVSSDTTAEDVKP